LNKLSLQINPVCRAALSSGIAALLFLNEFGTATENWWSLQPPAKVDLPQTGSAKHPIDTFIQHRLARIGLAPSSMAEPRTLIRRLHFDLLGLPPSPEAVARFASNPTDLAYSQLIDRLLASPHYGERWARHWLDVARYGESNGFEYNEPRRNAWPYRDWVINSLNTDMPYDEFVRMQVAGDILQPGREGAAAVGFLVAGTHNTVLGASPLMKNQARQDELGEIVGTVTQAFLGLTVQCARCHNHKTDPISTEEYHSMAALFAGVWHGAQHGMHSVRVTNPGVMRVHLRGSAASLGQEVPPAGVSALAGVDADFKLTSAASDAERRKAAANWMTNPANPLFSRVIVNRIWHHHFGRGLVKTPSDFGVGGGQPSHPKLLDWLTGWFKQNNYSLKSLHRLIVTSATYRQSSASRPDALGRDHDNQLLWRFAPKRLEGEAVRDSLLQAAGMLNTQQSGPSYEDVKEIHFNAGRYYHPIEVKGPKFDRRTIYRFSPRGERDAILDTFDCPDPSATAPTRAVTTTPLQALSLSNNVFVWRMTDGLANRVRKEVGEAPLGQVRRAWQLSLGREPDKTESSQAVAMISKHGLPLLCRALFNSSEFVVIE